jgi:hypothetical protein
MLKSREIFLLLLLVISLYVIGTYLFNKHNTVFENFQNIQNSQVLDRVDSAEGVSKVLSIDGKMVNKPEEKEFPDTIVENQISKIYDSSIAMKCNMIHSMDSGSCLMNGKPFVKYLFPIHLLKLPNGHILAVFNDGRLYTKDNLLSNMWKGPLKNSIPFDYIPLRMITINYKDNSLLGVGYDNKLYAKQANKTGSINITGEWVKVPNNDDIIYVIIDKKSKKLVAINNLGELMIKKTNDITSDYEALGDLNIPVLKLFYDSNNYMLALDTNFNLVQFKDREWTKSTLNYKKGVNQMRVFDIMYDNDGKLFGLVFVPGVGILELMKQQTKYFMSEFVPLEFHTKYSLDSGNSFLLNDINVIECKTGVNLIEDNDDYGSEENRDQDISYAYMKSIVQNKAKLREFCRERGLGNAHEFENYEMINNIQAQEAKIDELQGVIKDLMKYEPEKKVIQEEMLLMK